MALPRITDTIGALGYLHANLKPSIQNDVYPVIQANKTEGGYFAVPRLIFCYIDYLGALYSGCRGNNPLRIATTAKARSYLQDVMGGGPHC